MIGTGLARAVAAAGLMVAAVTAAVPTARAATPHRWVMGYYVGYQRALMPPAQIEWRSMTHLVVGPVTPRSDGTLDVSFDIDRTAGPAMAADLARRAKAHHVVPLLMIGGAGTRAAFRSAAVHHRAALEHNLVAVMRRYGYAGLDLDWEPIESSDRATVSALVTDLRRRLPHAVLTMPVLWITKNDPVVPKFYGSIARKLDRISVMSYGMAGAWEGWRTWHSSALTGASASTPSDVATNVAAFRKAGVPAAKLGVGVGFYGSCWTGGVTGPRQSIGSSRLSADDNVMSWVNIRTSYFSAAAYHYDRAAQAPYLSFASPHGPQHCTFVSYENSRSIKAKGAWAKAHGLGAIIVWTVNQGHLRTAAAGQRDALLLAVRTGFGA